VQADAHLDVVATAVAGGVVEQVLDRLAEHRGAGAGDHRRRRRVDPDSDAPGGGDGAGRGAHRRDHVGAAAGRLGGAALPEHLPGQRVELVDLADQQVHHAGGVHALGTEHADRLSHHAQRGHPPAELKGEHGEVVRRVVRCARRPAGGGH
jgi:hypothetical protein